MSSQAASRTPRWWESAVFYEVFLRSFCDSNGDGIGDIPGLVSRLDYLRDLGVDAIYLCAHYPSPFCDGGFDVTDFRNVDPAYGTLDDFARLLDEVHARGMYLIIDFVLNHTSDRHPWFVESRSSRDNPRRDWYVWRAPVDGGPPNNWQSVFHDSAWELDPQTGHYYYHFFLKEQPDLNWRNPEVRQEMLDTMRFWLDLGVDGFRLDALGSVFEDPSLRSIPAEDTLTLAEQLGALRASFPGPPSRETLAYLGEKRARLYRRQSEQPETHELVNVFRSLVDTYDHRVLLGETDRCVYYGNGSDRAHMLYNFPLMETPALTPAWVRANLRDRAAEMPAGAWQCNTLSNHDSSRMHSRYAQGEHDAQRARVHIALLLTLPGTPILYYGDEIGMTDLVFHDPGQLRDGQGILAYRVMSEQFGLPPAEALAITNFLSRDKCRSPMQWDGSANGGFCPGDVAPWLPVHQSHAEGVHVAAQAGDAGSLLGFTRRLIHVRRRSPALQRGRYEPIHPDAEEHLSFVRTYEAETCLVMLNMSARAQPIQLERGWKHLEVLLSTAPEQGGDRSAARLTLAPFEVLVARVS